MPEDVDNGTAEVDVDRIIACICAGVAADNNRCMVRSGTLHSYMVTDPSAVPIVVHADISSIFAYALCLEFYLPLLVQVPHRKKNHTEALFTHN